MRLIDFQKLYNQSILNPEAFWGDIAESEITWSQKWAAIFEWNFPNYQWFVGGKLNVTENCLDRHVAAGLGNKIAYIYLDENNKRITITYSELLKQVCQFANGLKYLGVKKGDRVAIYMPLVIEQLVVMLACARIGAVHSVIFAGFSALAVRQRLEDLQAKIIVTADYTLRRGEKKMLLPTVEEAVRGLEFVEKIVVLNRENTAATDAIPSVSLKLKNIDDVKVKGSLRSSDALLGRDDKKIDVDYHQLIKNQPADCPPEIMDSEEPLFVLYTSGSTGKPKGIVHTTGGYLVYAHYTTKTVFDIRQNDVYWCTADPGWITGHSYLVYGPLSNALTIIIAEGAPDYPAPDRWYKIIEQEKVSIFYTSPTAIRMLRKYGDEYAARNNLESLKILGSVGEPINPEVWEWYNKNFGGDKRPIVDTWWQTETGGHMIVTLPGLPQKPGRAGLPFFGIETDIVDSNGKSLPVGEKGFLVVKKPWPGALRNCWNNPERFAQYWKEISGVYLTGDFAIKDTDGYIQILGRSDDVINVSGHRIGTAEVENILVANVLIAEAAVIGKPDEIVGEKLKAFVVLKPGVTSNENLSFAIKKYVKEKIAAFAVPDEIEYVASLPKTRSGKIMRRVLKAKELGREVGDLSTQED